MFNIAQLSRLSTIKHAAQNRHFRPASHFINNISTIANNSKIKPQTCQSLPHRKFHLTKKFITKGKLEYYHPTTNELFSDIEELLKQGDPPAIGLTLDTVLNTMRDQFWWDLEDRRQSDYCADLYADKLSDSSLYAFVEKSHIQFNQNNYSNASACLEYCNWLRNKDGFFINFGGFGRNQYGPTYLEQLEKISKLEDEKLLNFSDKEDNTYSFLTRKHFFFF